MPSICEALGFIPDTEATKRSEHCDSVVENLCEVFGSNSELGVVWGDVVTVISNDPQILL